MPSLRFAFPRRRLDFEPALAGTGEPEGWWSPYAHHCRAMHAQILIMCLPLVPISRCLAARAEVAAGRTSPPCASSPTRISNFPFALRKTNLARGLGNCSDAACRVHSAAFLAFRFLRPAPVRAKPHVLPIALPFFPPGEWALAGGADFGRQFRFFQHFRHGVCFRLLLVPGDPFRHLGQSVA